MLCTKMAEPIEMLLGMLCRVSGGSTEQVLHGV